jgi:hypothetical protein
LHQLKKMDERGHDYSLAQFRHPFTCLIAGSTGCGKTQFLTNLLLYSENTITCPIQRLVYCYGTPLPETFTVLKRQFPFLETYQGVNPELKFNPKINNFLVLDDLMTDVTSSQEVANYFTRGSHHQNLSVFLLTQNMFQNGAYARTININSNYIVCFKSPRDKLQIQTLDRQMYPGECGTLLDAYNKATLRPHGYICIDLKQDIEDLFRLKSNLNPTDPEPQPLFLLL